MVINCFIGRETDIQEGKCALGDGMAWIFGGNGIQIVCSQMLPILKLNSPTQVVGEDPCKSNADGASGWLDKQKLMDVVPASKLDMKNHSPPFFPGPAKHLPDSIDTVDEILSDFLYGHKISGDQDADTDSTTENTNDDGDQYPSGSYLHSELFLNKSGVHLPSPDLLLTGHSRLRLTDDYMQTAVDAFAIILEGSLDDVLALPSDYVLQSARTIAIMRLPQEKYCAMWDVVLAGRNPETITYKTLEHYRPLFKYLTGKQMARLNLSDSRIINYIGTHPELTRHQVGVVASKYIKMNPKWRASKYLNNMNNLLCGVPMTFMRKIDSAEYLKLEQQVFYHVRACDPLQKRFYLNMMTRTQALGKSCSWSARDVSRLGLLLPEVEGPALASISPEAMAGISAHVMVEMRPENLKYLTELQIKYLKSKARNIMSRKLKEYDALMVDTACRVTSNILLSLVLFALNCIPLIKC